MNTRRKVVGCMGRQKSKLERNLIIALIVVLLLFIALLLFVIIKSSVVKKKCATPSCLTAASQIMSRLDTEVDPCEDFFKFSCGNFQVEAETPITIIKKNVEKQALRVVNESVSEDDHYLLKLQKSMYQMCLNQTLAEEHALEIINRTIAELGWPVVVGYQWREENFDWQQLIFKLRARGYPFQSMLDVGILLENDTYMVQVDSAKLESIKEPLNVYKKYMADVAVAFGAEVRRAEIEMEKVFDFREKIQKITEDDYDFDTYTIRKFQEKHGDIDWLHFLNNILYPSNHLSMDDEVIFRTQQHAPDFFNLLYRTPKRVIANYIIWSAIENFIPYLPDTIRTLKKNYECQTDEALEKTRSEFCTRIFKYFFPVPSDITFVRKYMPKTKQKKVKEIIGNIRNKFKLMLNKTRWLDDSSRALNLEKLESILDVIGAPYDYFNVSYLDEFVWPGQRNKMTIHDNFFQNLLNMAHMHQNNKFYKIHKKEKRNNMELIYDVIKEVNGHYCLGCNSMILTVGILQNIFYDENRPMYMNYGAIGSAIGHELTHGFGKEGSIFGKYGYYEEMWSSKTGDAYEKEIECMIEDVKKFHHNSSKNEVLEKTLEENLADYTGIRSAYSAYQAWVKENGEENRLVGVPYTPNQLFWISSITHQCFMAPDDEDLHADGTFRTIVPLRNTDDFAKDFNCPINSPMNPSKKCQVF